MLSLSQHPKKQYSFVKNGVANSLLLQNELEEIKIGHLARMVHWTVVPEAERVDVGGGIFWQNILQKKGSESGERSRTLSQS